jgi:hypothetical protein
MPQNPDPYRTEIDGSVRPQEPVMTRNDFVQLAPVQQNAAGSLRTQVVAAPIQDIVHKPASSTNNTNQVCCI